MEFVTKEFASLAEERPPASVRSRSRRFPSQQGSVDVLGTERPFASLRSATTVGLPLPSAGSPRRSGHAPPALVRPRDRASAPVLAPDRARGSRRVRGARHPPVLMPVRVHPGAAGSVRRWFPRGMPAALDSRGTVFVHVDPGAPLVAGPAPEAMGGAEEGRLAGRGRRGSERPRDRFSGRGRSSGTGRWRQPRRTPPPVASSSASVRVGPRVPQPWHPRSGPIVPERTAILLDRFLRSER